MKKIISVLLTVMLLLSCVQVSAQEFADISGHWAELEITNAYTNGIISGDGDGTFRPDDKISRAEFMKMVTVMLSELFEVAIPEYENTTHWADKYYFFATRSYLAAIEELSYDGVSAGVMSNENYNMPIKRWEMAYIIDNAIGNVFGVRAPNDSRFTDDEQINSTYDALIQGAISSVAGFGIVRGDENGNFNASAGGTRAEAVTIINRTTIIVDELISYTTQAQKEQEAYEKAIAEKLITYTDIPTGNPVVKFTMENGKSFKIKLYPEYAPQTCANFIKLVKDKFYDGLTFHRIVDGFVAQGGDPEGTGAGGSENLIFGEFYANGFGNNTLSHKKGVISMARSSHPNSASSQFFICLGDAITLDGQYAAFGEVIEGMSVVESFADVEKTMSESGEMSVPKTPVVIKKAEVIKAK